MDNIIVQQMVFAENQKDISVLSDDTYVSVLLLFDCLAQKLKLPFITESPKAVPKPASLSSTTEAFTENKKANSSSGMCLETHTRFRSARHVNNGFLMPGFL